MSGWWLFDDHGLRFAKIFSSEVLITSNDLDNLAGYTSNPVEVFRFLKTGFIIPLQQIANA